MPDEKVTDETDGNTNTVYEDLSEHERPGFAVSEPEKSNIRSGRSDGELAEDVFE